MMGDHKRFPSTWRIIPGGALIPWGVAMHNIKSLLPDTLLQGHLPVVSSHRAQTVQRTP